MISRMANSIATCSPKYGSGLEHDRSGANMVLQALRRALVILVAVMALSSPDFANETVQQRIDALMPGSELYLPEGDGPFPVVLQFHGCGGKKNLQERWAAVAKSSGWAVVVVDSYGHRRIDRFEAYATVCTG